MGRGDLQVEPRQRPGDDVQEARPVAAVDLDHREGVGGVVVDQHARLDGENLVALGP